ncbi:chromosome 21 open reading frame 90 [Homo sapiens]|nr:RecName: Full=Putative uncharacterized protein TSPEAR-AS2; AltName: Full=TSPEAR antisense RNA 2; AltName: Full=TSPEAR antisense gene protein 2 [Homo sapiens]AAM53525.1 C21orf90 protein form A [Homo sapiens]EAX09421.1 chromosome 21 open reading frame 90 [Homo sapiens]
MGNPRLPRLLCALKFSGFLSNIRGPLAGEDGMGDTQLARVRDSALKTPWRPAPCPPPAHSLDDWK